jgi:hypothetical protein
MSTWVDEYLTLVEDCEQRESRLTDWEREFIDSIRSRLEQDPPVVLSPKQTECLDRIWERATQKG